MALCSAAISAQGIDPEKVQRLLTLVERHVNDDLLPAAQIALARNGRLVVAQSYGSASDSSLICLFSAGKGVVYAAAWLLFQKGLLAEDELVADIIPEFGHRRKDRVTVQQLFTHTSGFQHAPFAPLQWNSKTDVLGRFSQWRLNWEPGMPAAQSNEITDEILLAFNRPEVRSVGVPGAGGFGEANSPQSFGHNGAGGQLAWVDPATGISLQQYKEL